MAMQTASRARGHDGNPVLAWCVGDVVGRPDRRGDLYPAKQRPERKTDAAVALMMAVGRAMTEDPGEGDLEDFLAIPSSPERLFRQEAVRHSTPATAIGRWCQGARQGPSADEHDPARPQVGPRDCPRPANGADRGGLFVRCFDGAGT
jgi:hypothetical protein